MTTRELHCPNLQVQKVASLVAPPRPVKPTHPPIADIIKVSTVLQKTVYNTTKKKKWRCC